MRRSYRYALLAGVLTAASTASAQPANTRVRDLNRQAVEAYQNLDLERAEGMLLQAQEACDAGSCAPAERARTFANLGIVVYGASNDAARASELFRRALEADPTVQLDPLISTPELNLLFQRARAEASTADTGGAGGINLRHTPPREQLVHTALPLFVQVPADIQVSRMDLRYKGNGMRRFATLPMQPLVDGFGVELACEHVFEPGIEYYFVAFDSSGRTIRTVGTEQEAFRVPIVASRTQAPPALPGRAPPEPCHLEECPPDLDCTRPNGGGSGGSSGASAGGSAAASDDDEDPNRSWMRLYAEVGPALSWANGRDDMRAADAPGGTGPEYDSYIQGGQPGCTLPASQWCVRVTENGSAFAWGLHVGFGAYFTERFGASLNVRIAPKNGGGTLAFGQFGLRLQYRIIVPRPEGLYASAHLGFSVGQIQIQPKQQATDGAARVERPWAQTGLLGAQVGGTFGYHFTPTLGVFVTPEFYAMFPNTGIGGNFIVGMDFAFGEQGGGEAEPEADEPEAPRRPGDRDRDGRLDSDDRCPDQAEDVDNFSDEDGCPDLDDDMDTIPDATDACKMEPEDMDGFEDTNGCPDPDNDADGVADLQDRCPMVTGPANNAGCPEPDRDGDGLGDRFDNCPDEPGLAENRGCQARQLVVIEGDHLEILDKIYFRTNSHVIDSRSYGLLDNIAAVLNAHPEIQMVHIEGHTDERGNAARNRTLSGRRANSVRDYLVRRGVGPTRLTAQGFGPDRPVFPGATTEAEHEANRRVEFRLASN